MRTLTVTVAVPHWPRHTLTLRVTGLYGTRGVPVQLWPQVRSVEPGRDAVLVGVGPCAQCGAGWTLIKGAWTLGVCRPEGGRLLGQRPARCVQFCTSLVLHQWVRRRMRSAGWDGRDWAALAGSRRQGRKACNLMNAASRLRLLANLALANKAAALISPLELFSGRMPFWDGGDGPVVARMEQLEAAVLRNPIKCVGTDGRGGGHGCVLGCGGTEVARAPDQPVLAAYYSGPAARSFGHWVLPRASAACNCWIFHGLGEVGIAHT
eukprot:178458-Chlamydomonas_euryale.AAC.2